MTAESTPPPSKSPASESAVPDWNTLPEARVVQRRRTSISWVWIVPLLAVLLGAWLAWRAYIETGPSFTISFQSAEGIEAGKTRIRYKSVDIGVVEAVQLSPERDAVWVRARMDRHAEDTLVEDTRFWVVRPYIAGGHVEGLGTLLAGAHIGVDVGHSQQARREFVGLERPPVVATSLPGRHFMLEAETLGSVTIGAPVFYRRLQVGRVESYALRPGGQGFTIRIFVESPYDAYVTTATRFWEASGVEVELGATGVAINTESLVSLLIGGIAFQEVEPRLAVGYQRVVEPVAAGAVFRLFRQRTEALQHTDWVAMPVQFRFRESVRGLTVGAPVEFRGLVLGEVTQVQVKWQSAGREIEMQVTADLYPERLLEWGLPHLVEHTRFEEVLERVVERGFRAQLRTSSLLTGQLYVALDFHRGTEVAGIQWQENPPLIPSVPSSLAGLEDTLLTFVQRLTDLPLESLTAELQGVLGQLNQTLAGVDETLRGLDQQLTPAISEAILEVRETLLNLNTLLGESLVADAPVQRELRDSLREVGRAAAALRQLADTLEQQPEALLRGRTDRR